MEAEAPEDLETLIARLFQQLTQDFEAWLSLSERFDGELFVGLFLGSGNEGLSLSRETLSAVTARGLEIQFDIYDPTND